MSERNVTIVCIVLLSVLLIGGGALLYWLEFSWIADLNTQIATLDTEIADARAKQTKLPGLKKQNLELEAKIKEEETRIPRLSTAGWTDDKNQWHFEYDELANLLDNLRKQANVFVSKAKFSPMQKAAPQPGQTPLPANVHKATYDLTVKGAWFNLLRFVNLLESQRRVIAIEKFVVKPATATEEAKDKRRTAPKHELNIKVVSYTYRDDGPAAGAAKAGSTPTGVKEAQASKSTLPPE